MSDREEALLIHLEVKRLCKEAQIPFILITGLPDTNGVVRSSLGLLNQENRDFMTAQFLDYMRKVSQPGFKPDDR